MSACRELTCPQHGERNRLAATIDRLIPSPIPGVSAADVYSNGYTSEPEPPTETPC